MTRLSNRDKGFTLIEVVIVLAIAAALILVVLLAVSGAQKSRRDSQRHNDAGRMASSVEQCLSNSQGTLTGNCDTIAKLNAGGYLTNVTDPTTGVAYVDGNGTTLGTVQISTKTLGAKTFCDGTAISSPTQYSIRVAVEQGSTTCVDDK